MDVEESLEAGDLELSSGMVNALTAARRPIDS